MPTNQIDKYEVEVAENQRRHSNVCSLGHSFVAHGFVYKNANAHCIYYAGWPTPEGKISLAIAIGEWGENPNEHDCICFGLEVTANESEILFQVIDPVNSPWRDCDLLGEMQPRDHALKSPLLQEVFTVTDTILRSHPALCQYLSLTCPNCAQA
jgi:hypothetical protein